MTILSRLLCLCGLHDPTDTRRLGFIEVRLCRRPWCARYVVRTGWR
jgi:hypothetical protein